MEGALIFTLLKPILSELLQLVVAREVSRINRNLFVDCLESVCWQISGQDLGGLGAGGSHGLLKWKGVVFTPDEASSSVDGDFADGEFVDKSSVDFDNESLCQLSPDDTNGQVSPKRRYG